MKVAYFSMVLALISPIAVYSLKASSSYLEAF